MPGGGKKIFGHCPTVGNDNFDFTSPTSNEVEAILSQKGKEGVGAQAQWWGE
jgi:hypothetical protein